METDLDEPLFTNKFFSKLGVSNEFWQIPVDEGSSKLLTFSTHFGRYKFTRLPFAIHIASEIFQIAVSRIIKGIEGARNMQDDIIVWLKTQELDVFLIVYDSMVSNSITPCEGAHSSRAQNPPKRDSSQKPPR